MRISLVILCVAALVRPATAQRPDSAAFVIRLGTDTVAVERYVRSANRLVAEAVQRSPSTVVHQLTYDFAPGGGIAGMEWSQRRPAETSPFASRAVAFHGDSAVVTTTVGGNATTRRVAAAGAIPMAGPFYTPYELAIMRRQDRVAMLPGTTVVSIPLTRVGSDSVALENQFGEPMRAHVDAAGRLLHLNTPAFTTVERLRWVDLDGLVRDFAARDETGKGLGPLSPRQTYRTRVGDANVWIDYSRPGKRGRPVWGALVPWNEVWRMGANDAAHIAFDRTIQLGELTLAPGTYTLFLRPSPTEWRLIVNRQTGISGLERDAAHDVGSVALAVATIPAAQELFTVSVNAGELAVVWDRTRASVPLRVKE
jgi:hypothetical protein